MAEKIAEARGIAGPHGGRLQIGYARATAGDPSLNVQLGALRRAGCELVFTDTVSAGNQQRPSLRKARSFLRRGDVLVVWRLDRLVGTVKTLVHLLSELIEEGVHFRSVSEAIDTTAPNGRFFFDMIILLAQMERDLIAEAEQAKTREEAEGKRPWAGGVTPHDAEPDRIRPTTAHGRDVSKQSGGKSGCAGLDSLSVGTSFKH